MGRRIEVYWAEDKEWYIGTLKKHERGHDDGKDNGNYLVEYDDGETHWEPLGRKPYRWVNRMEIFSLNESESSEQEDDE